jgi:hypothetical protein
MRTDYRQPIARATRQIPIDTLWLAASPGHMRILYVRTFACSPNGFRLLQISVLCDYQRKPNVRGTILVGALPVSAYW